MSTLLESENLREIYQSAVSEVQIRDEYIKASQELWDANFSVIANINKNRKGITGHGNEAVKRARKSLALHRNSLDAKIAELKRTRKGISLPKIEFLDQRAVYLASPENHWITWAFILYARDTAGSRHRPEIGEYFGLQTVEWYAFVDNFNIEVNPLTPDFLQSLAVGKIKGLTHRPYHLLIGHDRVNHYTNNMFLECRAYERSHFDDIPHLLDDEIINLYEIIGKPHKGVPIAQLG